MVPLHDLSQTRSSANWAKLPGNSDRLNTRAIFASSNAYGIPDLPAATAQPSLFVPYHDRHACDRAPEGAAVSFFLDDRHIETAWSQPVRSLSRLQRVGLALTPDFSLWREMPPVMQQWQVYRARWCGAWWLAHGIDVIPTASWSDEASHAFAFAGIAEGSVTAVSSVGVLRDREARRLFAAGYEAMLGAVRPPLVLCHGRMPCPSPVPAREYPSRWER